MQPLGVLPPSIDRATPALFKENIQWAEKIALNVKRKLPPSFDIEDLTQTALIAHWKCVEAYDPARNDNYRAYAYLIIRGAVLMSCRRKAYKEATHQPLEFEKANKPGESGGSRKNIPIDERLRVDQEMLSSEEQRLLTGSRLYVRNFKLLLAVSRLPIFERDVVRQVLAGVGIEELECVTPGAKKLLMAAVRRLKKELAPTARPAVAKPAATLLRRRLLKALPTLPPADACLVRHVHLDGESVAALAATRDVEMSPSGGCGCAKHCCC